MADKDWLDGADLTPEEARRIIDEDPEKALEEIRRYYDEGMIPRRTYEIISRFLARRFYGEQDTGDQKRKET